MSIPFGTDGWRGVIADDCTFDAIRRIAGAAAAAYLSGEGPGDRSRIVIGHDTRFYSPEFAQAAAEVFARAGIHVLLTDRAIPTPAVSFHVRQLGLSGGVSITASHNPAPYNGFKLKAHFGGSATPEMYEAVSQRADSPPPVAAKAGTVRRTDLLTPYRDRLASLVDLTAMRSAGLGVLADSMHGAAGTLLADILGAGPTRVVPFRSERDALFGGVHPEPIGANLSAAADRVRSEGLDLAVAQDGDADRLGVLDRHGRFVSPHRVLALLLLHAFRRRGLTGGIARTFSTSLLIDRVAAKLGAPLSETPIGFKYIAELMNSGRVAAGGEESGGYAFAFHLPERDGVLCALLLLESLAAEGRDLDAALRALADEFGELAYGRRDVYLPVAVIRRFLEEVRASPPDRIAGESVTEVRDKDGIKYLFGDRGWLLHRLSGTEPMIRLYCEHASEETLGRVLDAGVERLEAFARAQGEVPRSHL
ncbi:MAG: phosphoglucomutase/phosphomannomutase family protein [Thermoanaerobaculia bacterium]|nr:phosphoglucomutase/phosphomannomutase family protein [Thermoanaerobaculia bacterium]